MKDDGLFYGKDDKVPFTCPWKIGEPTFYRLEPVFFPPGISRLPVSPEHFYRRDEFPSCLIVVAERGGGLGHFLHWLGAGGGRRKAGAAGKGRTKSSPPTEGWRRLTLAGVPQLAQEVPLQPAQQRVVVDLMQPANLTQQQRLLLLGELAGLVESSAWIETRSQAICIAREIHSTVSNRDFSLLTARGVVCRLPHFSKAELELWAAELLAKQPGAAVGSKESSSSAGLKTQIAALAKQWVGGQPTLTHALFRAVDDFMSTVPSASFAEAFDKVGTDIAIGRPYVVDAWEQELEILLQDPSLRHRFTAYATSATKPKNSRFDDEDAQLFLAGWVGTNQDQLWGIRSLCHQQWAREILRG